jgi:L-arabinose isomerase
LLSVTLNASGAIKFVLAEGQSLHGPIPPTGNTNTHGRFAPDVRTFLRRWCAEGPTHHFALGIGHRAGVIQQLAEILGIEAVVASP